MLLLIAVIIVVSVSDTCIFLVLHRMVEVKTPASPISTKKPPPSERPLLRAKTVGSGLGINRQSKKAMLLRWCQRETQAYDVSCMLYYRL